LSENGTNEENVPPHFRVYKWNWTRSDIKYVILFLDDRLVFVKTGTDLDPEGLMWYMSEAARIGLKAGGRQLGPIGLGAAEIAVYGVRNTVSRVYYRNMTIS
jgi:hypothetical protein